MAGSGLRRTLGSRPARFGTSAPSARKQLRRSARTTQDADRVDGWMVEAVGWRVRAVGAQRARSSLRVAPLQPSGVQYLQMLVSVQPDRTSVSIARLLEGY